MRMVVVVAEKRSSNHMPDIPKSEETSASDSSMQNRRFSNAGEATAELLSGFNDWSANTGLYGIHMAYAVIAANWAVYGNAQTILSNPWAKYSVTIIISFLGLNLFCTWLMTHCYAKRFDYADEDKERWAKEYENEHTQSTKWPYNNFIQNLGGFIRFIKAWVPIVGGVIFILGLLFTGPKIAQPNTTADQVTACAPAHLVRLVR